MPLPPLPGMSLHGNRYRCVVALPYEVAVSVSAEAIRRDVTPGVVIRGAVKSEMERMGTEPGNERTTALPGGEAT